MAFEKQVYEHLNNLKGKDRDQQGGSYLYLMAVTEEPVDWAYEVWDRILDLMQTGDNRARSIGAQIICNLAKSDPERRMFADIEKVIRVTEDARLVTARHALMALWKPAVVNEPLRKRVISYLTLRFEKCAEEKNANLIRYDIQGVLRTIFDMVRDREIITNSLNLIDRVEEEKHRKKYVGVWKGVIKASLASEIEAGRNVQKLPVE